MAVSVVVTAVWQALDTATPSTLAASGLNAAARAFQSISAGHWGEPLRGGSDPPLVRYLGGVVMHLVGHPSVDGPVVVVALVFVPLLAWAVFVVADGVAGGWAAVAAVALALGAPITVSASHLFTFALPVIALTAAAVAALVAARRFASTPRSFAAGLVIGLGLLASQTVLVYVLPFALALVATGGWRRPRGIAAAAAGGLLLAGPWYVKNRHSQADILSGVLHQRGALGTGGGVLDRFGGQAWSFVGTQFLAPTCLLALVGVVVCVAGRVGRGPRVPYGIELVAGLLGGLILTAVALPGDRPYAAPLLIFVAVLAVCWLPRLSARTATRTAVAIAALAVVNATLVNVGAGRVGVTIGHNAEHRLTLVSGAGYIASSPRRGGDLAPVLNRALGAGFQTVAIDPSALRPPELSVAGVAFASAQAGVGVLSPDALGPRGVLIVATSAPVAGVAPCLRLADGSAIYLRPGGTGPLSCPGPRNE